jgi:hypothetical protein
MTPIQPAAPLIELHGMTKTYGSGDATFQALRGVDLEIFSAASSWPSWAPERFREIDPDECVRLSRQSHVDRFLQVSRGSRSRSIWGQATSAR